MRTISGAFDLGQGFVGRNAGGPDFTKEVMAKLMRFRNRFIGHCHVTAPVRCARFGAMPLKVAKLP